MEGYIVVLVTVPDEIQGATIARAIVEDGLGACVNIVPTIRSIYKWKGKLYDEGEALLLIKTQRALFGRLRDRVIELHPYEVPEVIAIDICEGHEDYLCWVLEETSSPD